MGFVGSATYSLLPRLIPTFLKRYPTVEFDLAESPPPVFWSGCKPTRWIWAWCATRCCTTARSG